MKIQTIFEALEQFKLGHDSPAKLLSWAETGLQRVKYQVIVTYWPKLSGACIFGKLHNVKQEKGFLLKSIYAHVTIIQFQVDHEDLPSKCKNIPNIDSILLAQLERQILRLKRNKREDVTPDQQITHMDIQGLKKPDSSDCCQALPLLLNTYLLLL